uniref:LRAT domain-containing protein n=1 Tax=Panagrolaimus sp. ES5 TaxID=591445 RepID=A0AC34FLR7_9BILA
MVFRVRFRSPNEIVETAKEYANGEYRHGEYNLIMKNCQHFATLCALGVEQCGDARTFFTALVNGALIVLPYIL